MEAKLFLTSTESNSGTEDANKTNHCRVHGDIGDIRRLTALAFPGMPSQMREVTACDHFLDALGDPDFALKIRERHPSNLELDVALQTALRLEAWTADTTRCCEVRKNEQGESMS